MIPAPAAMLQTGTMISLLLPCSLSTMGKKMSLLMILAPTLMIFFNKKKKKKKKKKRKR